MLVIRLSRKGRKNHPTYRIVLQEKDWAPSSKAIEILGHMDPHTDPATIVLKTDRIKYWLEQGAQTSNTVHNILVNEKIVDGKKKRSVFGKKKQSEEEGEAASGDAPAEKSGDDKPKEEPAAEAKPVEEKTEEKHAEEKKEEPAEDKSEAKEEKKEEPAAE